MAEAKRVVMLGTGDFAVPTFETLAEGDEFSVVALVTQPDRPQGRKQELIPSRIKCSAKARGIPVLQPENVNSAEGVASIGALRPDFLVTAAYGQILSAELLGVPTIAAINLHGSILPAYRGAAPVARAIERGETESGVTVIQMTPRIDAGGMLAVARTAIGPDETAGALEVRLAALGAPLVARTLIDLRDGRASVIPQNRVKVTKAPKLRKEDGWIDWTRSAEDIHNLVRAMQPWPMAYAYLPNPRGPEHEPFRVIIHRSRPLATETGASPGAVVEARNDRLIVAAGQGAVQLLDVQVPGKKSMDVSEFVKGHAHRLVGRFFLLTRPV